jgi:hypothetical protein
MGSRKTFRWAPCFQRNKEKALGYIEKASRKGPRFLKILYVAFSNSKTDLYGKGVKAWFFRIRVIGMCSYFSSTINASATIGSLFERIIGLMSISLM